MTFISKDQHFSKTKTIKKEQYPYKHKKEKNIISVHRGAKFDGKELVLRT